MIHSHNRSKDDPERRARALSRILDPEYSGQSPNVLSSSFRTRSPSLPRASVFVDRYGEQHDPDFRPFGSYPAVTPMDEPSAWPWFDRDDDDDEPRPISRGPASFPNGRMAYSATSSSYHSSISSGSGSASGGSAYGSRSRSISTLPTPPIEHDRPMATAKFESHSGRHISPPAHIPRSALFPWTPAQRAVRVQHEVNRRNVMPPPSFLEEEPEEAQLTLVDSRYVPGYGHFSAPPAATSTTATPAEQPQLRTVPESQREHKCRIHIRTGRARAHTAPSPTTAQSPEEEQDDPHVPNSPSSSHSFRQSIYSFGLKTKLGLHHMKDRVRRASGAAKRPLSL